MVQTETYNVVCIKVEIFAASDGPMPAAFDKRAFAVSTQFLL
jgi:hypothetical protein